MDVVPLIVIDTRVATSRVVDETILALQYPHKALFVVNGNPSSEVFSLLSNRVQWSGDRSGIPPSIRVVTDEQVPSATRKALRALVLRDPARFDKYPGGLTPGSGPLLHYRDDVARYSLVLPAGWSLWRTIVPSGCVAISSDGSLTVRVEAVEEALIDRTTRKAALLVSIREIGFERVDVVADGRTFAGEENAILYRCETAAGRKGTGVDVVRHAVRYRIHAEALPGHVVDDAIHALETSFQFARTERKKKDR